MTKQFSLHFTLFLFSSDLILALLALLLSTQARYTIPVGRGLGSGGSWGLPLPIYVATTIIWSFIFVTLNIYDPQQNVSLSRELIKVVEATSLSWMILAGMLYFSYRNISRLQTLYFFSFYIALIITHRIAVRTVFGMRSDHRYLSQRVLIIGTGGIAQELADLVRIRDWMGLVLEGFIEVTKNNEDNLSPILGTLGETVEIVEQKRIDEVIIALSRDDFHVTREVIYQLQTLPVNIRLVPDYFDMAFLKLDFENFSGIPLLSLKEPALDPFQRLVKRLFDLVVTSLVLVPALPIMGFTAALIRLDSPGGALFKQTRVGEGGKLFTMFKFRTMQQDAKDLQEQASLIEENVGLIHKTVDDPRVTRLGQFLRRSSLDELPQLFNVLRGEMSLVGPRPEMPWLVDTYEPWQRKRFEVPQGLTGWWQINGRSDRPMHLHTEDDLYYIQHYSLLFDIKILWRTLGAVLSRRGAY